MPAYELHKKLGASARSGILGLTRHSQLGECAENSTKKKRIAANTLPRWLKLPKITTGLVFLGAIPRDADGKALVRLHYTPSINKYGDKCKKVAGLADLTAPERPRIALKTQWEISTSPKEGTKDQRVTVIVSCPKY
ncbi:protein of unknown function [Methylocaldum szegediense]|uniref:Uncharacterized protein n=1 Tax=Methylocaldum szegediense TaxID=73780 RepID=A0ABM9I1K8_9GAMM|nr:protein of unknown function [Methylocaldum szegediense]